MAKTKVAVVAGKLEAEIRLEPFVGLEDCEVTFLCFSDISIAPGRVTTDIVFFDESEQMPGYMRGLAENLVGFDIVVVYESFQLSSFQAVKIAKDLGIATLCLVDDCRMKWFRNFKNIRAIQQEVYNLSDKFLVANEDVKAALKMDGVEEGKISVAPFAARELEKTKMLSLASRFRSYLKIGDKRILSIVAEDASSVALTKTVKGLALACEEQPDNWRDTIFLFSVMPAMKKDLSELLLQAGLGQKSLILAQDIYPFFVDMMVSSDAMVYLADQLEDQYFTFPFKAFLAVCTGVPVATHSTWNFAADGANVLNIARLTPEQLYASIVQLTASHSAGWGAQNYQRLQKLISTEIKNCVGSEKKAVCGLSLPILKATFDREGIEGISLLLKPYLESSNSSDRFSAYKTLGELHLQLGNLDLCIEALSEALAQNQLSIEIMKLLGNVSLQAHTYHEAKRFYTKVLATKSDDLESMLGLGLTLWHLHYEEEAFTWLEKAAMHPEATDRVLNTLCQIAGQAHNQDEAARVLEKVIEVYPEFLPASLVLGQIYLQCGQTELGAKLVSKAL